MPQIPELERYKQIMDADSIHTPEMVCGRNITQDPPYPNTAEYQDRIIVFCTRYCLEAFQADPDRFYAAHSMTKNHPAGAGSNSQHRRNQ